MINLSKKLILASNSPRRKQLLSEMGLGFSVQVANIEENFPSDMIPETVPVFLAQKKALALVDTCSDAILLCADTVVVVNGTILNKPSNKQEALEMLQMLSGTTHEVITGICMIVEGIIHTAVDKVTVEFRELTDWEMNYYIDQYQPYDKAGSYGIQEWIGMIGITRMDGSFYTVMGLPVHLVYQFLQPYITLNKV